MINAWSLLYEELNGTMDKTYPVENNELNDENIEINTGTGNTIFNVPDNVSDPDGGINTSSGYTPYDEMDDTITITGGDFVDFDLGIGNTAYTAGFDTLNITIPDDMMPPEFTALSDNDDAISHLIDKPVSSGIEDSSTRKYKEDESIEALKNYISTTYGGHYTSDNNSVQTLDLIESVGDAEAFCRSNAIKYLSRYDKKGQAKRDILKALHYSLLLYHFSGQLNETQTRGYETF